jgi:hypothetical protein
MGQLHSTYLYSPTDGHPRDGQEPFALERLLAQRVGLVVAAHVVEVESKRLKPGFLVDRREG